MSSVAGNAIFHFLPATADEAKLVRQANEFLRDNAGDRSNLKLYLSHAGGNEHIDLPESILDMLIYSLDASENKQSITVIPTDSEITTEQAAGLLNVSRPFVIKLADKGKIPCKKVGRHRRFLLQDVLEYRAIQKKQSRAILDQLAKETRHIDIEFGAQ